jgi:murein DD-endopeptidase MepM/ murein hydrolase activator NlpD
MSGRSGSLSNDFVAFLRAWLNFFKKRLLSLASFLDENKSRGAHLLYQKRGKLTRPFSHFSVGLLVILGVAISPLFSPDHFDQSDGKDGVILGDTSLNFTVLGVENSGSQQRGGVVEYTVAESDTVSSIAQKFNVSLDTVRWANDLKSVDDIKAGQALKILPETGVLHTVKRGETVYSIAKTYSTDPQAIVDFPFNTFIDDETFALAVGQDLIVPGGVMPKAKPWSPPSVQEAAPAIPSDLAQASSEYVWPTTGKISQGYHWYHKAIDIADSSAPPIVASRGGTVVEAGWTAPVRGYGIYVLIDHGDGVQTLYAHLSSVSVSAGQQVLRGQVLGRMGSTGRSTGTHLHFEIRTPSGNVNPLSYLQ